MNKFTIRLPDNGFGFPCNICGNRNQLVHECKACKGYDGLNSEEQFDLTFDIEQLIEKVLSGD